MKEIFPRKEPDPELFRKNLSYLPSSISGVLENLSSSPFQLEMARNGTPNLRHSEIFLHSRHDPAKEAERMANQLPYDDTDRIYLFIGAGLGYVIFSSLKHRNKASAVWIEANPSILKHAFEIFDFSDLFASERLQILIPPITEEDLYKTFKGKATVPVTIIPHRGSFQIDSEEYAKLRVLAEGFFQKKDVNLATLIRFEKIWTKNFLKNLIPVLNLQPVSRLFGIANCPILVVGAGPSLSDSIQDIQKYREYFLMIAVDTSVPILSSHGIEPDLIYTVDPQALNRIYLESYSGEGAVILDPTSTYLTPRLNSSANPGFFTLSPFPLARILESIACEEIGSIPFGGSVSTNAYALADLMKGEPIYLVGQDLAFSFGQAHAKGAIIEERLNDLESRRFRREYHNFKQLYYLPRYREEAFTQLEGAELTHLVTNEKMILFRNWFSSNATRAINLTHTGLKIPNIPNSRFFVEFRSEKSEHWKSKTRKAKDSLRKILQESRPWTQKSELERILRSLSRELEAYRELVGKGYELSSEIYNDISQSREKPASLKKKIDAMDAIDESVSSHKYLGDILSSSMQRAIYSVTEGFESSLTPEEKLNPHLGIAKKSCILYESLWNQSGEMIHQIRKVLMELDAF